MPVPDSQLRGLLSCRLSLLSYTGTPTAAGVAQQARAWLTPVQCYNKIPWDVMKLNKAGFNVPESYSLLKMPPVGCLISALKKAEDRQEVILRLFNPAESATCDATVAFSREVISCSETMMDEHITTEENQGSNLSGPFLPGQSRTFSYRLAWIAIKPKPHMRGQIVDKGRFVHAGYGMNALFGLQKQANSIYCRDDVDTGKRSASGNFAFIFTLKPRICGFIFNKIITLGELIII